ncbi:hypothetical protein SDRG_00057 [Saprolegnia diclina VS20]|uniref:Uncharacterized protein n=1 Tax=Saprolegnia diclina (strain VS20) TaxID=1156394 RepID=T0SAG9_SAPDV|nr:hypothetical protein SDRG_00057 [Saprolegnia diclina VS20]EQC42318.1 hypothetical protein SDRG_00057 [Saprolegnia diclina VS20]|eukprot:XP_008603741.1 hypothetical protein SDRG_00057 [Saprolegnia diclina VS20]
MHLQGVIVDNNATHGPEKTLASFDGIFDTILVKARKAKPPLATQVPHFEYAVIYGSGVFTPDELRLLTSDDKEASDLGGVWRRPSSHAAGLAEVDRYVDHAALSCVMDTKYLVNSMQLKPSELKSGLRTLESSLKAGLQQRQERWDAANSVVAKFEAHRPSMLRFAQSVAEGQKAAQLLGTTLSLAKQSKLLGLDMNNVLCFMTVLL